MTRDRNNKECRFRSQTFLEDQGVEAVRVVAGEGFGNTVDVAFVEGQGRDVVDGGFEFDDAAGGGAEAIFGGFEQERSDAEAAGGGDYVDGDNVAAPMVCGLGHYEASDSDVTGRDHFRLPAFAFPRLWARRNRDQGEGCGAAHVEAQFRARIGNSRRKTSLVNAPEGVEIFVLEIANGEGHGPL